MKSLLRVLALVMGCAPALLAAEPPLGDKTLVAWVIPANLSQKGGSVLTLDDNCSHFDGIVFGEVAPAKWMAGSDFFRRTHRQQDNWVAETADANTVVQIAIVYRGTEVTLYRNGSLYANYTIPKAQVFPSDSTVLIGLRHLNNSGPGFAGAIEDARIYDTALSAEQIAALKPYQVSDLKPWAWWSFDNKDARERTGRFPITKLEGGARVEDGKLRLEGENATLYGRFREETDTPGWPANPPSDWLTYHLAHPGPSRATPGDPNCAFYWKGRYHLHYIYHRNGYCFAHVSSPDLVHWSWHPTTLSPKTMHHGMFSGSGFLTRENRPAIIYHGQGSGRNQIALAEDDRLEKWSTPWPLEPITRPEQDTSKIGNWDPDAWLDGDTYYALSGGHPGSGKPATLFKSTNLKHWEYLGLFLSSDLPEVEKNEDISCPNFFKIGNKHMLLCISHTRGCRYYLGEWKDEKFTPDFHARMNWHGWDFFAPESLLTPDGRRVMWAWCNLAKPQSGIQSLPRELSLPEDGVLRIRPLRELEMLRHDERREANVILKPDESRKLIKIAGDALELTAMFQPENGGQCGIEVHTDNEGHGGFPITVDPSGGTLILGSLKVPFAIQAGEAVTLRVFIDKSMIEVFANDRQAAVASHDYAPQNVGVSLFSKRLPVAVKEIKAWTMKSIYTPPR